MKKKKAQKKPGKKQADQDLRVRRAAGMTPPPPDPAPRNQAGQFQKGASGNPNGRPAGVPNKTTTMIKHFLTDKSQDVLERIYQEAMTGNTQCLLFLGDRMIPKTIHLGEDPEHPFRNKLDPAQAEKVHQALEDIAKTIQ